MRDFSTAEFELNNPSKQLDTKWKYFCSTWATFENITLFFFKSDNDNNSTFTYFLLAKIHARG